MQEMPLYAQHHFRSWICHFVRQICHFGRQIMPLQGSDNATSGVRYATSGVRYATSGVGFATSGDMKESSQCLRTNANSGLTVGKYGNRVKGNATFS